MRNWLSVIDGHFLGQDVLPLGRNEEKEGNTSALSQTSRAKDGFMSLSENQRLAEIVQSEIRAMALACMQVQGINLPQGVCDTAVPPTVVDAAKHAMDHGFNTYTGYDGLAEFRQALAQRAVEAVPRMVSLQEPDWFLSMEVLEKVITDRTKTIVVNTPSNPSGKVFTTQELQGIAAVAGVHDLFIFTDEIYEYFVYDNLAHVSLASLPICQTAQSPFLGIPKRLAS